MKHVAVIGGGISGLSTCFYLTRMQPAWNVTLVPSTQYEPATLGGWLHTIEKDGFRFETGPRSLRVSEKAGTVLDIAEEIGVIDKIRVSKTTHKDLRIYADGKLQKLFPDPPFTQLKSLFAHPSHFRTLLANLPRLFSREKLPHVDDQCIEAFVGSLIHFKTPEDAYYIVHTYVDALVQGIYSGDITKLSARSCAPFAPIFMKRNFPDEKPKVVICKGPKARKTLLEAAKSRATAMNFEGGMSSFVLALTADLEKRGVVIKREGVTQVQRAENEQGKVTSQSGEQTFDYVVTTVAPKVLSSILPDQPAIVETANRIPHNSLLAINFGYEEKLTLQGLGYLVPTREKTLIQGVLYDSIQFPHLNPCLTAMVRCSSPPNPDVMIPAVLAELEKHTGWSKKPKSWHMNYVETALPQYEVGHHAIITEIQKLQPAWLRVSGQSIYHSGIPNCVTTAYDTVTSLVP